MFLNFLVFFFYFFYLHGENAATYSNSYSATSSDLYQTLRIGKTHPPDHKNRHHFDVGHHLHGGKCSYKTYFFDFSRLYKRFYKFLPFLLFFLFVKYRIRPRPTVGGSKPVTYQLLPITAANATEWA